MSKYQDDEIMSKLFELVKSEHLELKKKKKIQRKRTYTPEQRKVMLDNLRKGREVKAKKQLERKKALSKKHNIKYVEEKINKPTNETPTDETPTKDIEKKIIKPIIKDAKATTKDIIQKTEIDNTSNTKIGEIKPVHAINPAQPKKRYRLKANETLHDFLTRIN